jgi:hypothetical protein
MQKFRNADLELPRNFLKHTHADGERERESQNHRPGIERELEPLAVGRRVGCHKYLLDENLSRMAREWVSTAGPEKESGQNRAGGDSEGKAPLRRLKAGCGKLVPKCCAAAKVGIRSARLIVC